MYCNVLFCDFTGTCRKRTTSRYCCRFPFIYRGRRYNSCTRTRHNRPWCSLTPNYDRDKKWGNCAKRTLSPFSFVCNSNLPPEKTYSTTWKKKLLNSFHLNGTWHTRVSSTDLKVRATVYSTINSTTWKYCSISSFHLNRHTLGLFLSTKVELETRCTA